MKGRKEERERKERKEKNEQTKQGQNPIGQIPNLAATCLVYGTYHTFLLMTKDLSSSFTFPTQYLTYLF